MMSKKGNRMLALMLASVTAAGTIVGGGGAETKPETLNFQMPCPQILLWQRKIIMTTMI